MRGPQPGDPAALAMDARVGVAGQGYIDPRVQLDLSLEEAASLVGWLASIEGRLTPPVARELARALEEALADE